MGHGADCGREGFGGHHFDCVTIDFDTPDIFGVQGKLTELADGEFPADFVLLDCEGFGFDFLAGAFDEHNLGMEQAEQLDGVVGCIEVQAVPDGNILVFLGVIVVLFSFRVSGEGFLQRFHDFVGGLFGEFRPLGGLFTDEDFQFGDRLLYRVVVGETEIDGVTGETAIRFGEVGEGSELAALDTFDGLSDLSDC